MIDAEAVATRQTSEALTIVPFDGNGAAWDALVARCPESTFCHLAAWREIMADALGHETPYLVAVDDVGNWQGVLPLVRVRSPLLGHYLISMPFLNAGGPIGTSDAVTGLAKQATALARDLGVDLVELRTRLPLCSTLRVVQRKITVLLELPGSADELWGAFPSKLRSQIRRPMKEGLEARFGPEQREAFYGVFARNMRDVGTPVLPRGLFERIAATFPHLVMFGTVCRGAEVLAAGCGFVWHGEFEMTWASAVRERRRLAANMLLYWAFMRQLVDRGVRVFNFGRCSPGGSTHRFKQQWGGTDVPLPWAQWSARGVTTPPTTERPVFRVASAMWRRLPLVVANRLGPLIARKLP